MARRPDPSKRVLETALRLAAEKPWRDVSLAEIAAAAGVSRAQVYAVLPSRAAILRAVMSQVDTAVLGEAAEDGEGESRRDRLFDLLMRRLETLSPYKAGLRGILEDGPRDPLTLLASLPALLRSMAWMLEAAGIPAGGVRGLARVNLVAIAYLATVREWLADDSPDLSHTMASLDRALARAERLF